MAGVGFITEFTEPNACLDENLVVDASGLVAMQSWAVPRDIFDVKAKSGGDGKMYPEQATPGRLLINQQVGWRNDSPLEAMVKLTVTRASKSWVLSNPNAIQFRDHWTWVIDQDDVTPTMPITNDIFRSQVGSAIDVGTNSTATPNPGVQYVWTDVNSCEEWIGPVPPGQLLNIWYQCYVWTPPPWSDNANKDSPIHRVAADWTRLTGEAYPQQGTVVTG